MNEVTCYALFDFDGVIIDSESTSYQAWKTVFHQRGHALPLENWLSFVGAATGPSPTDLLESLTGTPQPTVQNEKNQRHQALSNQLDARPGIIDTVKKLDEHKVPIFIVSNADKDYITEHLVRLNLNHYITDIFSGTENNTAIPKIQLYQNVAKKLSLPTKRHFVIEDSPHGAKAALANNLKVIAYPNSITKHDNFPCECSLIPYPNPLTIDFKTSLKNGFEI